MTCPKCGNAELDSETAWCSCCKEHVAPDLIATAAAKRAREVCAKARCTPCSQGEPRIVSGESFGHALIVHKRHGGPNRICDAMAIWLLTPAELTEGEG